MVSHRARAVKRTSMLAAVLLASFVVARGFRFYQPTKGRQLLNDESDGRPPNTNGSDDDDREPPSPDTSTADAPAPTEYQPEKPSDDPPAREETPDLTPTPQETPDPTPTPQETPDLLSAPQESSEQPPVLQRNPDEPPVPEQTPGQPPISEQTQGQPPVSEQVQVAPPLPEQIPEEPTAAPPIYGSSHATYPYDGYQGLSVEVPRDQASVPLASFNTESGLLETSLAEGTGSPVLEDSMRRSNHKKKQYWFQQPPPVNPAPTLTPIPSFVPKPTPSGGLAPKLAGPPLQSCVGSTTPRSFWSNDFREIIRRTLGSSKMSECSGDPDFGEHAENMRRAKEAQRLFYQGAGCTNDFEVLCWGGTHGHDHQGANVQTARDSHLCDGGMNDFYPGANCQATGGTSHTFCTGAGKSNTIFINPKGAATKNVNVEALAWSCKDYYDLLIDFTKCIQDHKDNGGLRGVVVIPTDGIKDTNSDGIRHNFWGFTGVCPETEKWYFCKSLVIQGRALTIFAVQPLVNPPPKV